MKRFYLSFLLSLLLFSLLSFAQARSAQAAESVSGFKLPWLAGETYVTTGVRTSHTAVGGVPRQAIDFGVYLGRPILAMAGGDLIHSQDIGGNTNGYVIIDHNNGYCSAYVHLLGLTFGTVLNGKIRVEQGQQIGTGGGLSGHTTVHLHTAVYRRNGSSCGLYGDVDKQNEVVIIFDEVGRELNYNDVLTSQNTLYTPGDSSDCPSPDTTFCDVPTSSPHYAGIEAGYQAGLIGGTAKTINGQDYLFFNPDDTLIRQHAAYLIGRWLYGYQSSEYQDVLPPANQIFPDLGGDAEADRILEQLYRDGIFQGFSNGNIYPTTEITRQEFVAAAVRTLQNHTDFTSTNCTFPDADNAEVLRGCDLGLVQGNSAGLFKPHFSITRAEAMTVICRAFLSCDPTTNDGDLNSLRTTARSPRTAEAICFTASSTIQASAMPNVTLSTDGEQVCYNYSQNSYQLALPSATNLEFRVSPDDLDETYNCLEEGFISLEMSVQTAGQVYALITKCDGADFSQNGYVDLLADGQVLSNLRQSYQAGEDDIRIYFKPADYNLTGMHTITARVQSSDVANGDYKLSGPISLWSVPNPTGEFYSQEMDNDDDEYVCASNNILYTRFNDSGRFITVDIKKCDGSEFSQNGKFYITVDGQRMWGPFYYVAGETLLEVKVDHYGEKGLRPTENNPIAYQIELYSNDQDTLPKYSQAVDVWTEFADVCFGLNLGVNPYLGGGVTASPQPNCDGEYSRNTVVTLTALPNSNYAFVNWSGSQTGTSQTMAVTMNTDKAIDANFIVEQVCHTLNASVFTGMGEIEIKTPPNCGDNSYAAGTVVVLEAIPAAGYRWDGWSADVTSTSPEITIDMNRDKVLNANFVSIPAPVAQFGTADTSGVAPYTATFTDQSSGQISEWLWQFGDGATSTEQSPSYTYQTPGSYTVSLTVTGAGGSHQYTLGEPIGVEPPQTDTTISIELKTGWNLFSLPIQPNNSDITDVLQPISGNYDVIYGYEQCNGGWISYTPGTPPFANTLATLSPQYGYWVYMTQPATLTVTGQEISNSSIDLCTGWNLIGYPSQIAATPDSVLTPITGQYTAVYTQIDQAWYSYNPSVPSFANTLTSVESGLGYWILATEDTTLVID